MWCFWKSFTSYLHNGSTLEHNFNWFWKLQSRVTTFILPFLAIGHVTTLLTAHWINPDSYNHPYVAFLHFFGQTRWCFLFEVYIENPNMDPEYTLSLFFKYFLNFLLFFIRSTQIPFFATLDTENTTQQYWNQYLILSPTVSTIPTFS